MLSMCVFYFIFNTHLFYHVAIWHLLKYKLHYKLTVLLLLLLGYYIELSCDVNANENILIEDGEAFTCSGCIDL